MQVQPCNGASIMRRTTVLSWFVIAPLLLAASAPLLPPAAAVKIGARVGNITFKDIHYLTRSLDDFPKARVFVIAFTSTSCPVAQRYLPVLKALEKEYRALSAMKGRKIPFLQ